MKNKNSIFLILALGISSGLILINNFIVPIPDWLAIVLALFAIISLITFFVKKGYLRNR